MSVLKQYLTDPLFHFRKNTLNPVSAELVAKTDAALKTEGVSSRVEQLLAVGEEATGRLKALTRQEDNNGMTGVVAFAAGAALAIFAGTGLPAVAGVALLAFGIARVLKSVFNQSRALVDRQTLTAKINGEVLTLAKSAPEEVARSPRFQNGLAAGFNTVAREGAYEALVKRVRNAPESKTQGLNL